MNIFQGIFKARDKPKNLGGGNSFLWGSSSSGKVVNEKTAMQMTAAAPMIRNRMPWAGVARAMVADRVVIARA